MTDQQFFIWRSQLGGLVIRCGGRQLTIRTPWSKLLYSDRQHRSFCGWRFIVRRVEYV